MSRLLAFTIAVALLISLAGCSFSGYINVTGRPLREGEKTARVQIKNDAGFFWSPYWMIDHVEFSSADGYKGSWDAKGLGPSSLGEGPFYLPIGNFHLMIYMDHPYNWDIRETSYHVTYRFIGFKEIRGIDVEIKEEKEYIISPRGFYSLEEWRTRGRRKKRKNRGESFEVYP